MLWLNSVVAAAVVIDTVDKEFSPASVLLPYDGFGGLLPTKLNLGSSCPGGTLRCT